MYTGSAGASGDKKASLGPSVSARRGEGGAGAEGQGNGGGGVGLARQHRGG